MELSKISVSGTLWYLKKFLVFYYYIFLNDSIDTLQKRSEIINIFDNYINSLDESVRADAEAFFYSGNEYANLKSEKFKYFNVFCGHKIFRDNREKQEYYELCKRYYFMFLMGGAGQQGCKAII